MALALPYDLVFAPLDVLTAEEMNEIVQNYTTIAEQFPLTATNIADGSISTDKLANYAVTSEKLNYGSIYKTISTGTGLSASVGTSYSQIASLSISAMPQGAQFFAIAKVTFTGSSTETGVFTRLAYGSNYGSVGQSTTAWGRALDTWGTFTKMSSNNIAIQAMKDNNTTVNATDVELIAFRIG